MGFLFWFLWIFDLLLALFTVIGKEFRSSFTASDPSFWFSLVLLGSLVGSLLVRLVLRRHLWSLAVVAIPLLLLLGWYIVDKVREARV